MKHEEVVLKPKVGYRVVATHHTNLGSAFQMIVDGANCCSNCDRIPDGQDPACEDCTQEYRKICKCGFCPECAI